MSGYREFSPRTLREIRERKLHMARVMLHEASTSRGPEHTSWHTLCLNSAARHRRDLMALRAVMRDTIVYVEIGNQRELFA